MIQNKGLKSFKPPDYFLTESVGIWFTGLPGSGKTTVATALNKLFDSHRVPAVLLDGDIIRPLIAGDLGRSENDRFESLERYLKLCSIFMNARIVVVVSVINHSEKQRRYARNSFPQGKYFEVWVNTPLEVCKRRDPKGLYQVAGKGKRDKDIVGISIKYESPENPDITVETLKENPKDAALKIFHKLLEKEILIPA